MHETSRALAAGFAKLPDEVLEALAGQPIHVDLKTPCRTDEAVFFVRTLEATLESHHEPAKSPL